MAPGILKLGWWHTQHTGYTKRTCNKPHMGHMQDEWHVQHTWHIQDTGHTNEVGHNQHMGYTQCELYMQLGGKRSVRFTLRMG